MILNYKMVLLQEKILQVNKDVERYKEACSEANKDYFAAVEALKMKEQRVNELNKKIANSDSRLKQQQNLHTLVFVDPHPLRLVPRLGGLLDISLDIREGRYLLVECQSVPLSDPSFKVIH